jgi:four helix bundle protein
MTSKDFTDLVVWQKADPVATGVYERTAAFPRHQLYSLTSQMQRAAVSVPANLYEGFCRRQPRDKARFYNIAEGSAGELRYCFMLARKVGYLAGPTPLRDLLDEVSRMLRGLVNATLSGGLPRR